MKIFIVEDSKEKYKEIIDMLDEVGGFSCELAEEYVQAREKIRNSAFDVMILDMTLPRANDTRKFRPHAGKELMFDMLDEEIMLPTIVLTGYLDFGGGNKTDKANKIYIDLPVMLKNKKYKKIVEEDLDKIYDISNFYGLHEFLSDNIPFYLGMIYFQLQNTMWKKELLELLNEGV